MRQIAVSLALVLLAGAHACSSPNRRPADESGSGGSSSTGGKSAGGRGGAGGATKGAGDASAGGEETADAGAGSGGGDDAAGGAGGSDPAACAPLCPALFALASACHPDDMCTAATSMSGMTTTEHLCHGNGIKQVVDTMEDPATGGFTQTVKVLKSDGSTCYTIDVTGTPDGDTMTWKGPDGAMVAKGMLSDDGTSITCDGATKDVPDDAACPWVYEGPDDGDCVQGACN